MGAFLDCRRVSEYTFYKVLFLNTKFEKHEAKLKLPEASLFVNNVITKFRSIGVPLLHKASTDDTPSKAAVSTKDLG